MDNRASNLQWLTPKEHKAIHGGRPLFKNRCLDDTLDNRQPFVTALAKGTRCQTCKLEKCHCPLLPEEDKNFITIGYCKGMDFFDYTINRYAIVKKESVIVKQTLVPLGYPQVIIKDNRTGKSINIEVHKLMANTFLKHDFTEERRIIDHVNSDKNNNRLSNLRIVSIEKNNLFAHGVCVLSTHKETGETLLFTSIRDCAFAFFSVYPSLRSHLKNKLEYETTNHVFYRDLPAKHACGDKFYADIP